MSAIVVISIEGVLCERGAHLPIAQPDMTGIHLVRALAKEYTAIAFLTESNPALVKDWLKTYDVPLHVWIEQCLPDERAFTICAAVGRRGDRVAMYVDSVTDAFEELSLIKVPVLLYHSAVWAAGDWSPPSSWSEAPLEDEDLDWAEGDDLDRFVTEQTEVDPKFAAEMRKYT